MKNIHSETPESEEQLMSLLKRAKFLTRWPVVVGIFIIIYAALGLNYLRINTDQNPLESGIVVARGALREKPTDGSFNGELSVEEELVAVQEQFRQVALSFPTRRPNAFIVDTILATANETGVEIVSAQAALLKAEEIGENTYKVVPFTIKATGDIPEILAFLDKLEHDTFETLVVESVDILQNLDFFDLTLNLSIYGRTLPLDDISPTSSVASIPYYQKEKVLLVPFETSDQGGSGITYVKLYYKGPNDDGYTRYSGSDSFLGNWTSSPILFVSPGDGIFELYSVAVDTSGNIEDTPLTPDVTILIDATAPLPPQVDSQQQLLNGSNNILSWGDAADELSGVDGYYVEYSTDSSFALPLGSEDWITATSLALDGLEDETDYYYRVKSRDRAGNESDWSEVGSFATLDITSPDTLLVAEGEQGKNGWYTSPVTVTLTGLDDTSGIARTEYSLDGETWLPYTFPFTLEDDGTAFVQYRSTDNAGLAEETESLSISIDKSPPLGFVLINSGAPRTNTIFVTLELLGQDIVSGIDLVAFSYNGMNFTYWEPYSSTKSWNLNSEDGLKEVFVKFRDRAGNETIYSDTIVLDTTPPSLVSTSPGDGATNVSVGTVIRLAFDDVMNPASLNAETLFLFDEEQYVSGAIVWDEAKQAATFIPWDDLDPATIYTIIVTGAVSDSTGNSITTDYHWSFTTASS